MNEKVMKKILLVLYIFLLSSYVSHSRYSVNSRYFHLANFAQSYRLQLSYSVIKDRIILYKSGYRIYLRPGTDVILVNSKVFQLPDVVRKSNGNILIPRAMASLIEKLFKGKLSISKQSFLKKKFKISPIPEKKELSVNKKLVIILDAGHGGKDPGCINKRYGVYEKNIVLPVAKYTYTYLRKMLPHAKIALTRKNDRFLNLESRAKIANGYVDNNSKGIFISFHVNYSIFNSASSGIETFYYAPNSYSARKEKDILNYRIRNISRIYYNDTLQGNNLKIAARMLDLKLSRESKELANTLQRNVVSALPNKTGLSGIDFSFLLILLCLLYCLN